MSISKAPLGMNARNFVYIGRYNKPSAKRRADDKLRTKKTLIANDIPTSKIIHTFVTRQGIKKYTWNLPENGFVVKPARGYGGEGILVFNKWYGGSGETVSGKIYNLKQMQSHILDIFDGVYSLQSVPDKAYIEERITPHPFFKKLTPTGLPDIRVIVFNKIPVMAMLRLPTDESGGKANLHQGAIGIGIGLRTGITKGAWYRNKMIKFIPGTKTKAAGIRIPDWEKVLLLASKAQTASGLGFAGVDIVFDKVKGPLVLEVNARPGLSIQNVNQASLRSRLERVDELEASSNERGVEIARSMFAEEFSDRVKEERKILSVIEPITIFSKNGNYECLAKLDTGAYRTSIDRKLAEKLGFEILKDEKIYISSASGEGTRPAVKFEFRLGGKRITTLASVADRSRLQFPMIVGRRDLTGFYINPLLSGDKKEHLSGNDIEYDYDQQEAEE